MQTLSLWVIPYIVLCFCAFEGNASVITPVDRDCAYWKQPEVPAENKEWLEEYIEELQALKPGMTRAAVDEKLLFEAIIDANTANSCYRSLESPYIKMDIEYQMIDELTKQSSPEDKIIKISQPYLDVPIADINDDIPLKQAEVPVENKVWLKEHIVMLQAFKPGMTRADVNKKLLLDAIIGPNIANNRYHTLESSYIKIDIEYQLANEITRKPEAEDKIIKVSKPYLNVPVIPEHMRSKIPLLCQEYIDGKPGKQEIIKVGKTRGDLEKYLARKKDGFTPDGMEIYCYKSDPSRNVKIEFVGNPSPSAVNPQDKISRIYPPYQEKSIRKPVTQQTAQPEYNLTLVLRGESMEELAVTQDAPVTFCLRNNGKEPAYIYDFFEICGKPYSLGVTIHDSQGNKMLDYMGQSRIELAKPLKYACLERDEWYGIPFSLPKIIREKYPNGLPNGLYTITARYENQQGNNCFKGKLESVPVKFTVKD